MATPLERYEYCTARVDRTNAARTRGLLWNLSSIFVVFVAGMAVMGFALQQAIQPGTPETAVQSDAQEPAVGSDADNSPIEQSVYYRNCSEAWAAGTAPIYEGQPGYRSGLDGDNDGIACEPFHPR